jgi:hypothetical protein
LGRPPRPAGKGVDLKGLINGFVEMETFSDLLGSDTSPVLSINSRWTISFVEERVDGFYLKELRDTSEELLGTTDVRRAAWELAG